MSILDNFYFQWGMIVLLVIFNVMVFVRRERTARPRMRTADRRRAAERRCYWLSAAVVLAAVGICVALWRLVPH